MSKRKGHVHLIIGASKLGAAIAIKRAKEGRYVTVIDKDYKTRFKLGDDFLGSFVLGDATFKSVLMEANITSAKEVVIVTDDDDTNIYLANLIYKVYGITNIFIRINDNTKNDLLIYPNCTILNPFFESLIEYINVSAREDD